MLIRACVVCNSPELGHRLERILRQPDVIVSRPTDGEFLDRIGGDSCDLVIAARAAIPRPHADMVAVIKALPDQPELVVLSGDVDPAGRAAFLSAGAFAVLDPDQPEPSLRRNLDRLIRRRREALLGKLRAEGAADAALEKSLAPTSTPMRRLLDLAERVASSDSSLLIVGETGVGKEWLARWVHERGPRAKGPFVAVNCAALPGELVESELFGHEKGAFTGADRARRGQFELAHHGTLFLDEIAEMHPAAQVKLLRAIQDREIRRIGSEQPIAVDARIVAATNRDPESAVRSKHLREDLFYRLGVVTLEVPPLRERPQDIPSLIDEYLAAHRQRLGRLEVRRVSPQVVEAFQGYLWPGNVRELINALERAVLLCSGPAVTLEDIPAAIARPGYRGHGAGDHGRPRPGWDRFWDDSFELPMTEARAVVVEEYEREYLRRLLERAGGRVGRAAQLGEVEERTLYNKMRRYRLDKQAFRELVR